VSIREAPDFTRAVAAGFHQGRWNSRGWSDREQMLNEK